MEVCDEDVTSTVRRSRRAQRLGRREASALQLSLRVGIAGGDGLASVLGTGQVSSTQHRQRRWPGDVCQQRLNNGPVGFTSSDL
jgi:hypothetical protein